MKRNLLVIASLIMASTVHSQGLPKDEKIEITIKEKLDRMTLEEKIGQMCELTLGVLGTFNPVNSDNEFIENATELFTVDVERLDNTIGKYKIGSFLNVSDMALTPTQWNRIVEQINQYSISAIGIPTIYGLDMNHGASYAIGATLFPQNINMAATFNRDLVKRGGEICAYETRASNVPWTYNPTVDLSRNPLWPRIWENYGEDAFLSSQMGTQAVLGMQGEDPNHIDKYHIAANLKHFMGYGAPVSGKDRTHSSISDAELKEKHFAPYVAAVRDGHLLSIMVNSTNNNGIPFHANAKLLTQWMKESLEWDGLIVTDWADINNLWTREFIAKDKKDAIRIAINAGIDMAMEPYETDFCTLLYELVSEGKVSMERINDACSRVLRMKLRLGLFNHPNTFIEDYPLFGSEEFAKSSRQAATESMILLKNENNILPLSIGTKILVTGPNANSMRTLNGGWTYTWQGHLTDILPYTTKYNTILEALEQTFGKTNVNYVPGTAYEATVQWSGNWGPEKVIDIDAAVAAAEDADVIIACIGETSYCETPGNIDDLNISPLQSNLVKRLSETGKPIILILNEGRPRIINELVPLSSAIIDIMLPSNYGGEALASLLAGYENFSGKLPITYPKFTGSLVPYDFKKGELAQTMSGAYNYDARVDVQWPFGYGLSYTTFQYENLRVDKENFKSGDTLRFKVDVTNTGKVTGKESVLLYSSDLIASVSPDIKRLRQFDKIELKPGEKKTVELIVPADNLAFVNPDLQWILEEGDFKISVGNQSLIVTCTETSVF